jgi:hypothetical protein
MPAGLDLDPSQAPLAIIVAVGVVVLAVVLWRELRHRARRYGGGDLAAAAMLLAVVGILVALTSDLLPFEIAIFLLLFSLLAVLRPEQAVRLTGGPNLRWRTLREGQELQLLVRQRGGPVPAREDPEVQERLGGRGGCCAPGVAGGPADLGAGARGTRRGRFPDRGLAGHRGTRPSPIGATSIGDAPLGRTSGRTGAPAAAGAPIAVARSVGRRRGR